MLDALVLADRPVENNAFLGVGGSALQGTAPEADRFGGDQDALRVHAVQDVLEALALLADAVLFRHRVGVEEHLVRVDGVAPHLLDLPHFDLPAVEVGIEEREAGIGFRQQQDLLGDLGGGDPDFLPRD